MAESAAAVGMTPQAHRALRGSELTLLYLPLFTVSLGYGAVLPILPTLLHRLHGTADGALALHAGLLTGIYIGAFVVGAPLWGRLVDRRGPRIVLLIGLLGFAAATAWFGFAASLAAAYVSRFIAGVFAAGLLPATAAFVVARCREPDRSRHLGWVSGATVLGFLVGPALTGWVHDLAGDQASVSTASALHATAVPIWITGAIALISACGVAWGLGTHHVHGLQRHSSAASALHGSVMPPSYILILSGLAAFGLGAFEVGLSLQSQRIWRLSMGELAWLFAVCSFVMLAIQFALFAPLRRHVTPRQLVIGGFVLMAVGLALLAKVTTYGLVLTLVSLIAFGSGVLLPTLSVATADRAETAVGTAIGYQNAAGNLGQAAGSAAVGLLFNAAPIGSFGTVATLMVAAALVGWRFARNGSLRRC